MTYVSWMAKAAEVGDEIEGLGKIVEIDSSRGAYVTFLTEHKGKVRFTKRQPVNLLKKARQEET